MVFQAKLENGHLAALTCSSVYSNTMQLLGKLCELCASLDLSLETRGLGWSSLPVYQNIFENEFGFRLQAI